MEQVLTKLLSPYNACRNCHGHVRFKMILKIPFFMVHLYGHLYFSLCQLWTYYLVQFFASNRYRKIRDCVALICVFNALHSSFHSNILINCWNEWICCQYGFPDGQSKEQILAMLSGSRRNPHSRVEMVQKHPQSWALSYCSLGRKDGQRCTPSLLPC